MDNEIIEVPHWEFVWWNLEQDREARFAITGSHPPVEQRYIQKGTTKFHREDMGIVKPKWDTRWDGTKSFTTYWHECSICHKMFDIQEM